MNRRDPFREHSSHPPSGPTGGVVNSPHRSRSSRSAGRDEPARPDHSSVLPIVQHKNTPMEGRTLPGQPESERDLRERFPARQSSGYLPLLVESPAQGEEHPLARAGRLLRPGRLESGLPSDPDPGASGLQGKLDEMTRRLRQMQRDLQPGPTPPNPARPSPAPPERLHERLQQFLEEWNLWQDGRSLRDPDRELAEFCRSDYAEKLQRPPALAFLVVDSAGEMLLLSPGLQARPEFAGLRSGQVLEDCLDRAENGDPGEFRLVPRGHPGPGTLAREWNLPGGRLICLVPEA